MAKVYERIEPRMATWIGKQPIFFVATAPRADDGLVNVSPKGLRGTFGVLDEHTFAYVDMTASGIETVAHLRENGRICVMFNAFSGRPRVVRLHGRGRVALPGDDVYEQVVAQHPPHPSTRAVVTVDVERVSDSCGWGVPVMEVVDERDLMRPFAATRGPDGMAAYRAQKNATSLDGLPGL